MVGKEGERGTGGIFDRLELSLRLLFAALETLAEKSCLGDLEQEVNEQMGGEEM